MKKEKPLALIKSIGGELAGRAVVARLWIDANCYVGEMTELGLLRLAQIAQRDSQVTDQIEMRRARH